MPKPESITENSTLLSSYEYSKHEYSNCDCDVLWLIEELEKAQQEVELAKRRLGPAGYKVLEEHRAYKKALECAREELEWLRTCTTCASSAKQALTEIDKIKVQHEALSQVEQLAEKELK